MERGWNKLDALCGRHCAFALYRLPGEDEELQFCMQADGGLSERQGNERGFCLAPFDGSPAFIRHELSSAPVAEAFAPLPPQQPATPASARAEYERLFALYRAQMPERLQKIVLARTEDAERPATFSPTAALQEVCERFPQHFNALLHSAEHGTWLCSTPELLLRGHGFCWQTMALAGTRPACEGEDAPWDEKNCREQAVVSDFILQCLLPLWHGGTLFGPDTLRTGRLEHLCTRFCFRMPAEQLPALLSTLPPTPAVCGFPLPAARDWLRQQPDIERGLYAGYLGPVGEDEVALFVTLRCMRLYSNCCRLYAGGGLMPDSTPEAEWRETEAKMQSMRQLLLTTAPQT